MPRGCLSVAAGTRPWLRLAAVLAAERSSSAEERLAALDREVRRVADRLRTLALSRLGSAPADGSGSPVDAARGVCRRLEQLTAEVAGRPPYVVPVLADAAVADQVAVLGGELLAALRESASGADDAVAAALDALVELRRRL